MPKTSTSKTKQKTVRPFKPLSGKMLIVWVAIFAIVGGAVIYKSLAASGTISFTLTGPAVRVPSSGTVGVSHWSWECYSGLHPTATYSIQIQSATGVPRAGSTNYANGAWHQVYLPYGYYSIVFYGAAYSMNCTVSYNS